MEFRALSNQLEKSLKKDYRKEHGIFFTPKSMRDHFINEDFSNMDVLEPSFGSGEFIMDILDTKPTHCHLVGIEISEQIYQQASDMFPELDKQNVVELFCKDFIAFEIDKRFDRVIGNPPYKAVMGKKKDKEKYRKQYPQLDGKFDLYILFLLKCLSLLKEDGILKFVIPTSFINVMSFNKVRKYIVQHYTILDVITFPTNKWLNTTQRSLGIIIQNKKGTNNKYSIKFGDLCLIHDKASIKILQKYKKKSLLKSKGFPIKTGEIVWNFVKEKMTDDASYPLLVHNSNLKNGKLDFSGKRTSDRKLYIKADKEHLLTEKTILVNRGHGNNGNLPIQVVLVDPSQYPQGLVVENHIYKIMDNGHGQLEELYQTLCSLEIREFIQLCSGGGGLTKTFLELLPV
jgi:tRNA1(Val) A37 N6-methylase TrmN6